MSLVAGKRELSGDKKPDFFIVGAPRCGTSALAHFLAAHPDIFMARKEMHFFGRDLHFGPQFYRRDQTAYLAEFAGRNGHVLAGEASVWYLFSEQAAGEIKAFNPDARIIILLRDPVAMLYSLYHHFRGDGNECLPTFEAALAAEQDRKSGRHISRQAYLRQALAYRATACYTEQVRRYFEAFGRERVRVIIHDDFVADAPATYRDVLDFLGVASDNAKLQSAAINENRSARYPALGTFVNDPLVRGTIVSLRSRLPRPIFSLLQKSGARLCEWNKRTEKRPPLSPDSEASLRREFAPEVERLGALLKRDLTRWNGLSSAAKSSPQSIFARDRRNGPVPANIPDKNGHGRDVIKVPIAWFPQTFSIEMNRPLVEKTLFQTSDAPAARRDILQVVDAPSPPQPALSVIVLNYNGMAWLDRCLESIRAQTISDQIEVIVDDNASTDQSARLAEDLMRDWPNGQFLQHQINLGYAGGNNRAAAQATGRYLLFLSNDTWLEPDCLEQLLETVETTGATAATPLVMDYKNDRMQSVGESGFDIFGFPCGPIQKAHPREVFAANGPALLIERNTFEKIGRFDGQFFMYAEDYDLCWRTWLAGGRIILATTARAHHRAAGATGANSSPKTAGNRTSDTKRFYANRNNLLVLLKNCQHALLLMVPLQILLLAMEAVAMGLLTRRWAHVHRAYVEAVLDCWRLRRHIAAERRRLRRFRRHGDFWMLRFLRPQLNRWREMRRFQQFGLPTVDPQ